MLVRFLPGYWRMKMNQRSKKPGRIFIASSTWLLRCRVGRWRRGAWLVTPLPGLESPQSGAARLCLEHTRATTPIYDEYRNLKDLSERARYFGERFSIEEVKTEVLPSLRTIKARL